MVYQPLLSIQCFSFPSKKEDQTLLHNGRGKMMEGLQAEEGKGYRNKGRTGKKASFDLHQAKFMSDLIFPPSTLETKPRPTRKHSTLFTSLEVFLVQKDSGSGG